MSATDNHRLNGHRNRPELAATSLLEFREKTCDESLLPALSVQIPPDFVEAVASRVAELLAAPTVSPYLTVDEAAQYLRCSRQRVYDLLSSRRLTKLKDGSRVLLRRDELDEYVAG